MKGVLQKDVDVECMFEKFSVEEIRSIEKKTRLDIEGKREELRQMVGERYRELIEAADTITEMKNSSENVLKAVGHMHEFCQQLPYPTANTWKPKSLAEKTIRVRSENSFYSVAAQMKLLIDIPDKIWNNLDEGRYLHACQLYLLACHMYTGLQVDPLWSHRVNTMFPVLTQQWAIIRLFHSQLLELCRQMMARCSLSDEMIAECLCVVMLLADKSPMDILEEFLAARLRSISQTLDSDDIGVKNQLSDVTTIVVDTVHQLYNIFYCQSTSGDGGLLYKLTNNISVKEGVILNDSDSTITVNYLPATVRDYRPMFKTSVSVLPSSELKAQCQQWLSKCESTIHNSAQRLLQFVISNKALASICADIQDLLTKDVRADQWRNVCDHLIGRELLIWEELLQQDFTERTKELLKNQLNSGVETIYQQMTLTLKDLASTKDKLERDLPSYVWHENNHDILSTTAWTTVNARQLADSGGLAMKSHAYTPAIQSLCKNLDARYQLVLDECKYYQTFSGSDSSATTNLSRVQADIQSFVQSSSKASINKLLDLLHGDIKTCRHQLEESVDSENTIRLTIDRVLLIGRFVTAVSHLCPNLRQCVSAETGSRKSEEKQRAPQFRRTGSSSASVSQPSSDSTQWTELKNTLFEFSRQAYEVWLSRTVSAVKRELDKQLGTAHNYHNTRSLLKWEEMEISETTDDGKTVKSVIRVPMQASAYLLNLLYLLCGEINRIGCHSLHKSIIQELAARVATAMVNSYETMISEALKNMNAQSSTATLNQRRALQWLFDLRFITKVIPSVDANEATFQAKWQSLIEKIESQIDPFDLDVFMPHIQSRLAQHVQQCSLMYGAIMSSDKHNIMSSSSSRMVTTGGQPEQHNVLWLSPNSNRFTLLPLSVSSRQQAAPPIVQPPKAKALSEVTTASQTSLNIPVPQQSQPAGKMSRESSTSNFLGQLGSIWFSNVDK